MGITSYKVKALHGNYNTKREDFVHWDFILRIQASWSLLWERRLGVSRFHKREYKWQQNGWEGHWKHERLVLLWCRISEKMRGACQACRVRPLYLRRSQTEHEQDCLKRAMAPSKKTEYHWVWLGSPETELLSRISSDPLNARHIPSLLLCNFSLRFSMQAEIIA